MRCGQYLSIISSSDVVVVISKVFFTSIEGQYICCNVNNDYVPVTDGIDAIINNAGNDDDIVEENNNDCTDITTNITETIIDTRVYNNNKEFLFGSFNKVHHGDDCIDKRNHEYDPDYVSVETDIAVFQ